MIKNILEEKKYQIREITKPEASKLLKQNMELIVNNIHIIMNEKKINQSELAFAISSDRQHVNYIIRSKTGITVNVLGRIAKALGTTISELSK